MNVRAFLILIILSLAATLIAFMFLDLIGKQEKKTNNDLTKIKVGEQEFLVEIVRTLEEKKTGLSGREFLPEDQGMLFVYDYPQELGFWMKGMLIPLDFIWLREGEVVRLDENIEPEDVQPPDKIIPEQLIDMVLEVKSGAISLYQIKIGDELVFLD